MTVVHSPDTPARTVKLEGESDRYGPSEIWACDANGSNCDQLTSLHGFAGAPRWSPDGHHVAFEFGVEGHSEIYVVEVPGGYREK